MRIRVLHVIDHLGYGGAPFVVKNIAEKIDNQHIETFVCALRTNPDALPIEAELINLTYRRYNPFAVFAIAKLCKKYEIDIVHAHLQKSIISSLLASFFCNSKIIIHEHGPILRGRSGFVYRLLLKLLCSRAAIAIANSQATGAALLRTVGLSENSVHVVNNFIDFDRLDPARYDRNEARDALGIDENKIAVGFMGRFHHCKGADLLVQAAAILCEKDRRFCFVIVGDGPERNRLEELVLRLGLKENVIFTGICKNSAEVIKAFDIAVIPSRREAFGISAIEFMRMKIPVVASPVGGLVELVRHEQTGILLDSLTAENIANAVSRIAGDSPLRERLTKNAEQFCRKFDGKIQLQQIEEIYRILQQKSVDDRQNI